MRYNQRPIPTDDDIQALLQQAAQAGDLKTVSACSRALKGSARARKQVTKIIDGARAEASFQAMREIAAAGRAARLGR